MWIENLASIKWLAEFQQKYFSTANNFWILRTLAAFHFYGLMIISTIDRSLICIRYLIACIGWKEFRASVMSIGSKLTRIINRFCKRESKFRLFIMAKKSRCTLNGIKIPHICLSRNAQSPFQLKFAHIFVNFSN